jgi:TolA-binding protein
MIREQAREMLLDAAILAGLLDDSNQAREILDRVSQYFPGDETAKEIRKALE